ncbi:MAG: alpha/beta fold hydrolase [Betaproteobacteria bacterium]|nr:alpha/beta fold hydrolase [Betaproteobacteria bacterium]
MHAVSSYRAPAWLPGGHLQTLYPALCISRPRVEYRRRRWDTADRDFLDLDWADGPESAPLVALFHGLEGDSSSHYALALMRAAQRAGWRAVVVHFRGCSGEPNWRPRAYHSGDAPEVDWLLRRLARQAGDAGLFAAGVSLGGNALLKWLGNAGADAADVVCAAAAVSAPMDLHAAGDALEWGLNRLYTWHFLKSLKPKSLEKLRQFPDLYDRAAVSRARTLREFDNLVTAPLHGFRDTDDYWTRASSKPQLAAIRVPTLIVNALNDPIVPAASLPGPAEVSSSVTLEFPRGGGHAGFVTGPFPGRLDWLPGRLIGFFREALGRQSFPQPTAGRA